MPCWPRTVRVCDRWTIIEQIAGTAVAVVIEPTDDRQQPQPGFHHAVGPAGQPVTVRAASRTRWLVPEPDAAAGVGRDNFGFAAWAEANAARLAALGPGAHRGIWFGAGIGHDYGLAERRFALLDIARWHTARLPPGLPETVARVPVLAECTGRDLSEAVSAGLARLAERGSVLVPGAAAAGVQAHSAADPRFIIEAALTDR